MAITKEQLEEKYKNLPEDVKSVIFSADVENIIGKIGEKYSLHIDQMGELIEESELIMIGISNPKDFVRKIQERLEIKDEAKVRAIAEDVSEKLFLPIRESLKKVHGDDGGIEEDKKPGASSYMIMPEGQTVGPNQTQEQGQNNLIGDKLSSVHAIPKEESNYVADGEKKEEVKKEGVGVKYTGEDPYREPIE